MDNKGNLRLYSHASRTGKRTVAPYNKRVKQIYKFGTGPTSRSFAFHHRAERAAKRR
jgi:hypothetical protein